MSNETIIRDIFVEYLGVENSDVTPDATNNDLQMDSLDKVDVVQAIEKEFGLDITDSEFDRLKQFSDYVELVERKVSNERR